MKYDRQTECEDGEETPQVHEEAVVRVRPDCALVAFQGSAALLLAHSICEEKEMKSAFSGFFIGIGGVVVVAGLFCDLSLQWMIGGGAALIAGAILMAGGKER